MVQDQRVRKHPILKIPHRRKIHFYFKDRQYSGYDGEVISSALFACGMKVFGHHHRDGSPQGIFCANGQCSQCTVIADGRAVKSCMEPLREGMKIYPLEGLPDLPPDDLYEDRFRNLDTLDCDVMIIGGGPSGIMAAVELGKLGRRVILVDDKDRLGGKLILQTHSFFGSVEDCFAGTRGIDIATIITDNLREFPSIRVFLNSTALGVFVDGKVGVVQGDKYFMVKPEKLLITAGAREKALGFPGCDLPGVYGAGAFQTLLNRDLVCPSKRLFIIGGGNVGLIAGYHAMQAGIKVVGLVEAMPSVGGYKVHSDKLKRLGVPIYVSHTVTGVEGDDSGVKFVNIAQVDESFRPIKGTEKKFAVDTVLIAVGLNPISEMYGFARQLGMDVYSAGDSAEIAEASAAIFSGKIAGLQIASALGERINIPQEWLEKAEVLKSRPGRTCEIKYPDKTEGVFPVIHCFQEIPCNPCTGVCPHGSISIRENGIMGVPSFDGKCSGCRKCVAVCPGLAITLVDFRKAPHGFAHVTVPFELDKSVPEGKESIPAVDVDGNYLCPARIIKLESLKFADRTLLLTIQVPSEMAVRIAGVRVQSEEDVKHVESGSEGFMDDDFIVCRCSRVSAGRIREQIRKGVRDMNQLKAMLDVGMGACGGKTCEQLVMRLFRDEGVPSEDITPMTYRPMNMEVTLGILAGLQK